MEKNGPTQLEVENPDYTLDQINEVKKKLLRLADGESVQLGDFGDADTSSDADVQALIIRELADLGITKLYEM